MGGASKSGSHMWVIQMTYANVEFLMGRCILSLRVQLFTLIVERNFYANDRRKYIKA